MAGGAAVLGNSSDIDRAGHRTARTAGRQDDPDLAAGSTRRARSRASVQVRTLIAGIPLPDTVLITVPSCRGRASEHIHQDPRDIP
jgi:hypothetical protein